MFVPTSEWPLTESDIQCSVCRRWCHDTGELVEHERVHIPAERCSMCRDGISHSARCHHDEHEVCDRVAEGTDAPRSCACPCHSSEGLES